MRIALVICPHDSDALLRDRGESLALGYLGATLRAAGHEVRLLNASLKRHDVSRLIADVLAGMFDLVGISVPESSRALPSLGFAARLREAGFAGLVCAGGPSATFEADALLAADSAIDVIVLHEGEQTICELAGAVEAGHDWRQVAGLAFRRDGLVRRSMARPQLQNLDRLPFPIRDDLPWVVRELGDAATIPILTSRGCHYNCAFCSVRAFNDADRAHAWRRRSVDNVLDEIGALLSIHDAHDLLVVDDLFVSGARPSREYAAAFSRGILGRGYRLTFTASASVDALDAELLSLLKRAGLRHVLVGAEAANATLLRSLNRWFTPVQIATALRTLDEVDLDATISYINFTPMTTIADLRENLAFFGELGINLMEGLLNRYQVHKGTPLYDRLERDGRLRGAFPRYGYASIDPRVDLTYTIARQALGCLSDLDAEVKRIERPVGRRSGFVARTPSSGVRRDRLHRLRRLVNEDVASLFGTVLDFAESHGTSSPEAVRAIVDEIGTTAQDVAGAWLALLRQFEVAPIDSELLGA